MEITLNGQDHVKRTEIEINKGHYFFLNNSKQDKFIEWNELDESSQKIVNEFYEFLKDSIIRIEELIEAHQK